MDIVMAYGPQRFWRNAARRWAGAFLLLPLLAAPLGAAAPETSPPASSPPAAATPKPVRLLVLGDSLSAGYGLPHADGFEAQLQAALHADGHEIRIVDGAVSGDTTAGGLARLDWTLGADGADAAIVELGANDGLRGVDPDRTEANLAAILDKLHARGIPVLLAGMMALPNMGPEYATRFTATYQHLAQRPDVVFEPFFLDGVALHPDLQLFDRLHPNAAGVKVIVAHILPDVRTLLARLPHDPPAGR